MRLALLMLVLAPLLARSQLTWTPIYVGGESQIDLWTQSMTGCPCSFNSSKTACACCVLSGGCSCGAAMPNRCTQCGLENYCANMCNVTLDSRQLFSKSDRGFGQIKSPQLEGPSICTYRFVPDTGQRVELQVWRMISIGRHNGTACEGGWLEFDGGARICGRDSRLQQPIVLFSDKPEPILRMQINEDTDRSQVYAFYSFASNASTSVGWPGRGGRKVPNTECDWVYDENQCRDKGCVLASPGYPGLYPPHSRCRYLVTSNCTVSISVTFTAVLMPSKHCTSNYIAVYAGSTTNSVLLKTLCEKQKSTVSHIGKDLLVEFRSGPEVAPFDYNGFVATLHFTDITTEAPATTTMETTTRTTEAPINSLSNSINMGPSVIQQQQQGKDEPNECDVEISGDQKRTGSLSTRGLPSGSLCRVALLGRDHDTVHVSLASYNLSFPACKSQIEVFDGLLVERLTASAAKALGKICGPASETQHQQKQITPHEFNDKKRYSSTTRSLTIFLTRYSDEDFMDVSYYFHNDRESGTQQPKTHCDVEYYGMSSPRAGIVMHPRTNRGYNAGANGGANGANVKCKQHFIPSVNQAVVITLNSTMNQTRQGQCTTQCGDQGCRCASDESLDGIDHLLLVSRPHGNTLACLCGNNRDWLPVEFWSAVPVYIEWSRSSLAGLNLTAEYEFAEDSFCGNREHDKLDGEIRVGYTANFSFALNRYYQQKCTYVINAQPGRELVIYFESPQTRPCTAWNLTVHEYNKTNLDSPRLFTFCSRDDAKNFTVAPEIRSVIVKLQALGRTAPQYTLRWRSFINNTRSRSIKSTNMNVNVALASGSANDLRPTFLGLLVFLLFVVRQCATT